MTVGCNICEGSRRMDAHVGTFMEATLSLRAGQREVVGQSWVRPLISAVCFMSLVPLAL